jgi:glycosyltransferase involved in cell wall biosynthesis
MGTVLDVITAHIDVFATEGGRECERFGVAFAIHQRAQDAMREEYATADRIRVMSAFARHTFLARGFPPARVAVVSPPLTLERAEITERPRQFCVGFVGALEPWKGVHYLVEAFRRVAGSDWQLVLVGGTGARPIAEYFRNVRRADSRIAIAPADVRAAGWAHIYGRFSVLVYPSVCDGFGQSVAEAMACGVPVIVTTTTGAADLVESGRTGVIVPPRDPDSIAESLYRLAREPDLCRQMGLEARETVLRFTPERFWREYAPLVPDRDAANSSCLGSG